MKLTKFGHSCMLVEQNGVRILLDPGIYSTQQNTIIGVDFVLITHEHADHFSLDSLKNIINNNSQVRIITNSAVGELLQKENIEFTTLENNQQLDVNGILIEGVGESHAIMHSSILPLKNTGYMINRTFFYPGDALIIPPREIKILALPVAGPWLKLSEAIDYALEVKPAICFAVHDGILKQPGSVHTIPALVLEPNGITFIAPEINKEYEF